MLVFCDLKPQKRKGAHDGTSRPGEYVPGDGERCRSEPRRSFVQDRQASRRSSAIPRPGRPSEWPQRAAQLSINTRAEAHRSAIIAPMPGQALVLDVEVGQAVARQTIFGTYTRPNRSFSSRWRCPATIDELERGAARVITVGGWLCGPASRVKVAVPTAEDWRTRGNSPISSRVTFRSATGSFSVRLETRQSGDCKTV